MQGLDIGNRDTTERMRHDPGLLRLMAKVRVRDALHALAVNDIAAAEFALDSAIALDPENGDAYLRRAVLRRRQKRIEDAVVAIREAERLLPKNANVHMELADLLIRAGDLESAIIAAEEAIALDPKSPHGYFHLSIALSQGGRHAEALLAAERAMAAAPDQARFRDHHETLKRLAETPAQQGMRQS